VPSIRDRPLGVTIALLALYYGALGMMSRIPFLRPAFSQERLQQLGSVSAAQLGGQVDGVVALSASPYTTLLAMVGALLVVLPVAWVYTLTKERQRYDQSLVQTVIVLPIAVAGITIIVANSIALAFSLAGIVAAVRFRNTLKDTKDAVYVFLAIGVGLAAGVQALDMAFVMSATYNVVILGLWKANFGGIYSESAAGAPLGAAARRVPRQAATGDRPAPIEVGGALAKAPDEEVASSRTTGREHAAGRRRRGTLRWDVPSQELFERFATGRLPLGLRGGKVRRTFYRDIYFDTPTGELEERGVSCRLRIGLDDRRWISVMVDGHEHGSKGEEFAARVDGVDPERVFAGDSKPARRLRALVDPERLTVQFELETERRTRRAFYGVLPFPQLNMVFDTVTVRRRDTSAQFRELALSRERLATLDINEIGAALERLHDLKPLTADRRQRAALAAAAMERDTVTHSVQGEREIAVVAVNHGRLAFQRAGSRLTLPLHAGSGEAACRTAMGRLLGNSEGELRLLGTVPASGSRPALEVWLARRLSSRLAATDDLQWFTPSDILARVGSPVLREPRTLAALAVAARSELLPEWATAVIGADEVGGNGGATDELETVSRLTLSELRIPTLPPEALDSERPVADQFINAELSALEFNARVLGLAEDRGVPLLARARFLSIVNTNLDEFYQVRVAGLKHAVAHGGTKTSLDGLTPAEQLDAIAIRLRPLVDGQYRCFRGLVERDLPAQGIRLRAWHDLSAEEQGTLRRYFLDQVFPILTPKALTRSPGHPLPHASDGRIGLALALRDAETDPVHYSHLELPEALPRLVPVGKEGDFVPLEEVVRWNLGPVYPGREIVDAWAFRVTRSGDLQLDEQGASSFVQAIEEELRRRPFGPIVRMEVELDMPEAMRNMLEREFRFEESAHFGSLPPPDLYAVDGLLDLGSLRELAALDRPELDYPMFEARPVFAEDQSVFDAVEAGAVLVHHPYDAFESSVERFVVEAADDPDVVAIKITLYRLGSASPIVTALKRAAAAGKSVSVFVELKARFDEEHNIRWARGLESAGIHVVTGLAHFKTHAKVTLVVRRVGGSVQRYVHIGTGNYNPVTARLYTDVGIFTADEGIASDATALFNELTGSSRPPQADFNRLLVAPTCLLDRLLAMVAREAEHAAEGRGGRIRAKLNALADGEMIGALYRAAQAGVDIDLVVRGICMLRPGVPGLSDRIRVVSVLGRFLEHARIYHFANGGNEEYYLGSADWRPRNLRRRVEAVVPVVDPAARERLDAILTTEFDDPFAWELNSDGTYTRRSPSGAVGPAAQEQFLSIAAR
jgi:polyphosphate kinase